MSTIISNLETKTLFNFLNHETLSNLSVFLNINKNLLVCVLILPLIGVFFLLIIPSSNLVLLRLVALNVSCFIEITKQKLIPLLMPVPTTDRPKPNWVIEWERRMRINGNGTITNGNQGTHGDTGTNGNQGTHGGTGTNNNSGSNPQEPG